MGQLAAGVAHEINNPLAAILSAAEFALASWDNRDDARGAVESIVEAAIRGGKIVDSVLTFARNESSAKRPEDLNTIISQTRALVRGHIARHGATLQIDLGDEVPAVLANGMELQQVVTNLIRNAAEAGAKNIVVSTRACPTGAEIRVEDDGPGLDEEQREHIFDPFFTTRQKGTGLGLSIAYGIVSDHGGSIDLRTAEGGGGSIAVVTLPSAPDDQLASNSIGSDT